MHALKFQQGSMIKTRLDRGDILANVLLMKLGINTSEMGEKDKDNKATCHCRKQASRNVIVL